MSKMSEISLEIRDLLEAGMNPIRIAKLLEVPLPWVYDTLESMESEPVDVDCYYQEASSSYR